MSPSSASWAANAGVVLFLFRMEAEILHHDDGAGMDLRQGFLGDGADAVGGEGDLLTDRLGNGVHHLFQRVLLIRTALGTAEMRQNDDLGAGLRKLGQGRSQPVDAGGIRNDPVLGRDVQVGADQDRLAVELKIVKGFEVAHRCRPIPWFRAHKTLWHLYDADCSREGTNHNRAGKSMSARRLRHRTISGKPDGGCGLTKHIG